MNEDNDIAIVGIGCMFPGADNVDEFWQVLINGEDHVREIPPERFIVEAFYDPDPDHPHKTYVKKAGLIKKHDEWDNKFFGISDKEAEQVDPQQHFLLESVHMALEDAGIPKEKIAGSDTGVYIGAMNHDWNSLLRSARGESTNTTVTGTDSSILSARIAYVYNLLGPAITLNTACSSSMVAFHMAAQALKNGEISMAIAGGVSFILDPDVFVNLSSARMASPTGKCHTFSQNADGYARGEGCGIVIMKRLTDALCDRNKIWGILFTGLNQDGHTSSPITSPSGTGTSVGDFTEVDALGSFFSNHSLHEIYIGSVKANIGHLESGAGVAALIKVLLMMKNGLYVPSLHAEPLNPKIPFSKYMFKVCQEVQGWEKNKNGNRIAAINCFGFGGTNAHAIVTDYNDKQQKHCHKIQTCLRSKHYVVLSAEDMVVLFNIARNLGKIIGNHTALKLEDLSSTTLHFRSHYKYRKVFVVENIQELVNENVLFSKEEMPVKCVGKQKPKIVFVYCGVGTTWKGMCKELIKQDEIFKNTIKEIDDHLSTFRDLSLQAIFENEEDLTDPLKNHLAIFACQIGLTAMWGNLGIVPVCIVGQSVGEVAAAYASKTLSLRDAVKVIYFRSINLAEEKNGKMIVIQNCKVEVIEEKCSQLLTGKANVAVYHSPLSCAVSGDASAIEELKTTLIGYQVKVIPLNVQCAYHSHLTEHASVKLEENVKGLSWTYPPKTNVISTVSGQYADESFGSASYWAANVFQPVQFQNAIKEAKKIHSNVVFLEIGPNPVLKAHLHNIFPDSSEDALPSMKRNSEIETFRKTFIDIFGKGIPVLWENVCPITENILQFPLYQFNKRKHLFMPEQMRKNLRGEHHLSNNMLISPISGSSNEFEIFISKENTPFVYEHLVDERVVMPGAIYGEIGMEIGNILTPKSGCSDFSISWSIHKAFLVKDHEQKLLVKARRESETMYTYETFSHEHSSSISSGKITFEKLPESPKIEIERLLSILRSEIKSSFVYTALQTVGFQHGPIYRTIKKCGIRDKEVVCEVLLSDDVMNELQRTCIHPVVIDTMFQSCIGIRLQNVDGTKTKILPAKVSQMQLRHRLSQHMICYTKLEYENPLKASFSIFLLLQNGSAAAEIRGFQVEKVDAPDNIHSLSYYEDWTQTEIAKPAEQSDSKNVILISWNHQFISLLQNAFNKKQNTVTVYSILLTENFQKEISVLKNQACIRNATLIFIPGIPGIDDNTTGKRLIDSVRNQSNAFLQLLKVFYEANMHIVVVTNETQPCVSKKTKVIGAELWGMVRAVTHEGTKLVFTLLDIDCLNQCALQNIIKLSTCSGLSNVYGPRELAIRHDVVFSNNIRRMPESFHTRLYRRSLQMPPQATCFSIRENVNNADMVIGIPSIDKFCQAKICVKPIQVLPCNTETFFSPSNNYLAPSLSEKNIYGNEIRICEIDGVAKLNKTDIEVIACCHLELKSELKIDKKFVIPKSRFKGYKIGHMHSAIIALTIADHIATKSNVLIAFSKKNETLHNFLNVLLKEKKCFMEYDQLSWKSLQHTRVTDLIILNHDGYIDKEKLCLQYPSLRNCVFLKNSKALSGNDGYDSVQFHYIDVDDLYEPSHLCYIIQRSFRVLMSLLKQKKAKNLPDLGCALNVLELTKQIEIRTPEEFLIRKDSAYVVVGGLTGLGWLIIKYLAKRNAKLVISLSRRSLSKEAEQRILNITNLHGTEIIHTEADITNLDNLTKAIRSVQQKMPNVPIRGVFQGAAVLNDNTVPKMTQEAFNLPLDVKILGTWNLHVVTKHMDLDIFLMHSSVASAFGNYSQTNYAAANAFEDSFSHYRASLGLPTQTINWGALAVGMGSNPDLKDIFHHKGMHLMSAEKICTCLTQMLLSNQTQGIFVDFDIKRFLTSTNLKWQHSKYVGLVPVEEELSSEKELVVGDNTADVENMTTIVKNIAAKILMMESSELKDTNALAEFGVDSQNAIEIMNTIFAMTKGVNQPDMWRKMMQFVIRLNSTLRRSATYINRENESAEYTDVEDFIFIFEHAKVKRARNIQILELSHSVLSVFYDEKADKEYVTALKPVPAWLDKPKMDIASLYEMKLRGVVDKCKEYWKNRLGLCKTSSSLQNRFGSVTQSLSDSFKYTHKAERISLIMEVDLRFHIPELQEQIYPCSNFVPIISTDFHDQNATLEDILTRNNKIIENDILHSLLPFVIIKELNEFDSQIHEKHSFLFNMLSDEHQYINFESVHIERSKQFETMLYALHNQTNSSLEMEFHFCPERIDCKVVSAAVDILVSLIDDLPIVCKNTFTLTKIQKMVNELEKKILPAGKFFLVNYNGKRQVVNLAIEEGKSPALTWGKEVDSKAYFSDIKNVSFGNANDKYKIELRCKEKHVTFETPELDLCQMWLDFVRSQSPVKGHSHNGRNANYSASGEPFVENTYL
uniref:Carrier domain-containing protein n=1 Tax=Magallana gigas TaxID=29159 RepID=A0A8W8JHV5_MAGGI